MSSRTGIARRLFALVFVVSLSLAAGCDPVASDESVGVVQTVSPIINGSNESGWPAVGALVMSYPFYGFTGSFCSGTLIDKRWVLTAAHCATASDDFPIAPGIVSFMFTNDARPTADGARPAGTLVQADYFIPNENWDGQDNDYDLALVHLVRDVTEVAPLPVNSSTIGSYSGQNFFFVGFGVDDGANETGGGLKRSAYIPVSDVRSKVFSTDAYNTAVCFGDSGGPALYKIGGDWKVVGVNSAVMGYGNDPCIGVGIHVRVDAHTTWINNTMNNYPPDCRSDSGACLCADACSTDGTCDVGACHVSDCGQIADCVLGCYSSSNMNSCGDACFIAGDEAARELFDNTMGCYATKCYPSGTDWTTCMTNACNDMYNQCYLGNREKLDCPGVYTCYTDCIDAACRKGCEWLALDGESSLWTGMKSCMDANCADMTGAALTTCLSTNCQSQTTACLKPAGCDPTGGDCPEGKKCRQFMEYSTTCVDSQGIGVGEKCKIEVNKADPCADGLVCVDAEGGRLCRQVCSKEAGCQGEGEVCKGQPFPSLTEWGWCGCTDLDDDKSCAADDCDDTNSAIYPGAREWCDGIDNDCDDTTDEGCNTTCADADSDGSCDDADCDDANPAVHPGAIEACGDSIDNNCDGNTDEGCSTCTDLDKDGYCSNVDCNDRDYRISPNAQEICGDGIDNNCSGTTDEDCQVTGDDVISGGDATAVTDDGQPQPPASSGCSSTGNGGATGGLFLLLMLPIAFIGARRRFN